METVIRGCIVEQRKQKDEAHQIYRPIVMHDFLTSARTIDECGGPTSNTS